MDRLPRTIAACGLGLLLTAAGCRGIRPEVPPGRPYGNDGRQRKAIEFSSEGHAVNAAAGPNFAPSGSKGSNLAAGIGTGTVAPDPSAYGTPPAAYGGPGTSGLGQPPRLSRAPSDPSAMPAALAPPASSPEPAELPPPGLPPAPELDSPPPPALSNPAPNPIIPGPIETPGTMGQPDQMPSPY